MNNMNAVIGDELFVDRFGAIGKFLGAENRAEK
jgi:hypothetical protein